jgi:hypothetical protein
MRKADLHTPTCKGPENATILPIGIPTRIRRLINGSYCPWFHRQTFASYLSTRLLHAAPTVLQTTGYISRDIAWISGHRLLGGPTKAVSRKMTRWPQISEIYSRRAVECPRHRRPRSTFWLFLRVAREVGDFLIQSELRQASGDQPSESPPNCDVHRNRFTRRTEF